MLTGLPLQMTAPRLHTRELGSLARDPFNPNTWPSEKVAAAIHEASHAIVAMSLGQRVTLVTIWPNVSGPLYWEGRCDHRRVKTDLPFDSGTGRHVETAVIIAAPWAARAHLEANARELEAVTLWLLLRGTASEDDLRRLAPAIATTWETYDAPEPAPAVSYAPPARHTRPGYRIGTQTVETRDLIPGLRYSKIAPITQCGR